MEGLLTAGGQRGIIAIITDLHEHHEEIRTVATKLAAMRQEVLLLHIIGRAELEFAYHGTVTFEELETGRRIEVDADAVRPSYLAALRGHLNDLRRSLEELQVGYARFPLDQPLDVALRQFLTSRARLR
jgi:hypothetical protein